jgi:hypothetical protein
LEILNCIQYVFAKYIPYRKVLHILMANERNGQQQCEKMAVVGIITIIKIIN